MLRNAMKNGLILLLALCTLFLCAQAAAEQARQEAGDGTLDMEVEVGFNGLMTYGKTMPVRVRIRNFGEDFEGTLGMNAYISTKEYDRYEKTVFVPAGSERQFELAIAVYTRQERFTAELMREGETVCTADGVPDKTVNPGAMLIGVLSTRPQNLNNLNIDRENDVLGRYEMWQTVPLTADTFPEDASLLGSFGMLVIDDIDPASLSGKQQEVLDSWLRSGRVLICGGGAYAARNTAFFSRYTGLRLEGITSSDSVAEGLEKTIGRTAGSRAQNTALAEYSGAEALGSDAEGRGLIWRTTFGGGRIYTAAFETGDPRLNSESLMHYFWQQLLVNQDQEVYNTLVYSGSDNYSAATVTGGYAIPVAAKSHLPAGMLIVAGVLVFSCVMWAVLKKRDRRQWMWLILPLAAAAAAAGILLLSAGAETNRPLAVIADNLVQDGTGSVRDYCGISVAVPSFGRHRYSVDDESLRMQIYDYVDYDEEEEDDKNRVPDTLRTCYTSGGESSLTAESRTPWEQINLMARKSAQMQGQITGMVWMEEDGLHGEVVNGTDTRFQAGRIVTTYGYVSVPALAPGEKADFALSRKTMADPDNPVYEDGGLYADHPGLYSVVISAVGYNNPAALPAQEARDRELASSMINGAADILRQGQGNWSYGAYESALFLYAAKPENASESVLKVDGIPVEQKTGLAVLTAELPFAAVGRTGVVFRSAGMDMPERVETDDSRMPTDKRVQNSKQTYYHTLSEDPTFLFVLDGMEGVKVERLQVVVDAYYSRQARAYALNTETHEWDEIKLDEDISDPGRYLDSEGKLYLQFRDNTSDMYADIPTPLINLEGRLEHAEN